jgi:hypothetical protein
VPKATNSGFTSFPGQGNNLYMTRTVARAGGAHYRTVLLNNFELGLARLCINGVELIDALFQLVLPFVVMWYCG